MQIGHTGQRLHNSAPDQPKHYTGHESDLIARVDCLMADVDRLLTRLHALPPETGGTAPATRPADAELGWLFNLALRHNPTLARPRSELAVLAARTRQAGAPTDPLLSFELMELPAPLGPLHGGADEAGFGIGLSRMFESYGKRGLRREIASRAEELLELELAQMELDLMYKLTETYYDLFGLVARRRALDANLELTDVLLQLATERLSVGLTSQAEVLSAQVQLSRLELMRIELTAQIDQTYIALAGLIGPCPQLDLPGQLQFDAAYPLPPEIEWDNDALLSAALDRYPAYMRVCFAQSRQDLEVEMARREYHPDYELMGRYEAGLGRGDSYSLEVEVPLHLNKAERQDARLQETYAEKAVLADEADAIRNEYVTRVKTLQVELRMHGELVDLLRQGTVPQARLALESAIAAYASGTGTPAAASAGMAQVQAPGMAAPGMDAPSIGERAAEGEVESLSIAPSAGMGSGIPPTTLGAVLAAQQVLLDQEQELEQNYIHILHTLSDLQVLTLGAFDPLPYMIPSADLLRAADAPRVISPLEAAAGAAALSMQAAALELSAARSLDPSAMTRPPGRLPQAAIEPAADGFIEGLALPVIETTDGRPDEPQDGTAGSSGEHVTIPLYEEGADG